MINHKTKQLAKEPSSDNKIMITHKNKQPTKEPKTIPINADVTEEIPTTVQS